jgi:hypothetical protein
MQMWCAADKQRHNTHTILVAVTATAMAVAGIACGARRRRRGVAPRAGLIWRSLIWRSLIWRSLRRRRRLRGLLHGRRRLRVPGLWLRRAGAAAQGGERLIRDL